MTVQEKAKAYDEALERAKGLASKCLTNRDKATMIYRLEDLETIFPELAESEDDRIRKNLMAFLISHKGENRPTVGPTDNQVAHWVAWLEKQGEQKLTDLRTWKYIVDAVLTEREGIGQYIDSPWTTEVAEKLQKRFGSIDQKPKWSKEDEEKLHQLIHNLEYNESFDKNDAILWLKSIKDRCTLKQSLYY